MYRIYIALNIEIIPYVRMTRRGKYVNPYAIRYNQNQKLIKDELFIYKHKELNAEQRRYLNKLYYRTPLAIEIEIHKPKIHTCDFDNLIKAVLDAGNLILYNDDRWIDRIIARRENSKTNFLSITLYTHGIQAQEDNL